MPSLIVPLINNISESEYSHYSSFSYIWKEDTNSDIIYGNCPEEFDLTSYDCIYIYNGQYTSEALNFYGGLTDKNLQWIRFIFSDKNKSLEKRYIRCNSHFWYDKLARRAQKENLNLNISSEASKEIPTDYFPSTLKYPKQVIIGDSHAPSLWNKGYLVDNNDFKTLYGALESNLIIDNAIRIKKLYPSLEVLQVYFGNIDLRHHLCRQEYSEKAAQNLAERYVNTLSESLKDYYSRIIFTQLLPIEDTSRRIPKTGYYKDTPFFGSWEQRENLRNIFNDKILSLVGKENVYFWKDGIYTQLDGKLPFEVMEKPQSVHLARKYWDYNLK